MWNTRKPSAQRVSRGETQPEMAMSYKWYDPRRRLRFLDTLRLLAITALVCGPIAAYVGWRIAGNVTNTLSHGIEAQARVAGTVRSGKGYALDLTWTARTGETRTERVMITGQLTQRIIAGGRSTWSSATIRYRPDATSGAILVEDAPHRLSNLRAVVYFGLAVFLIGGVATALSFSRLAATMVRRSEDKGTTPVPMRG